MAASASAFKSQNEKRYGNVEKMYIHFYTVATGSDTLDIFWYCNDIENIELFSDHKHFFATLKSYGYYTTYTGDIFIVKNLQKFKEILILLGAKEDKVSTWSLANDATKEVHEWKVEHASKFNELFDVCFEDYEIINSFSSEPSLAKNRVEMDELITNKVVRLNDMVYEVDKKDKNSLIMVTFGLLLIPMKYHDFNQLH
jgi:hypothetical protein